MFGVFFWGGFRICVIFFKPRKVPKALKAEDLTEAQLQLAKKLKAEANFRSAFWQIAFWEFISSLILGIGSSPLSLDSIDSIWWKKRVVLADYLCIYCISIHSYGQILDGFKQRLTPNPGATCRGQSRSNCIGLNEAAAQCVGRSCTLLQPPA